MCWQTIISSSSSYFIVQNRAAVMVWYQDWAENEAKSKNNLQKRLSKSLEKYKSSPFL